MDPASVIARVRDGRPVGREALSAFARGLADGAVDDAQAGAFAMAVLLRGLSPGDRQALTLAMRDSGEQLAWNLPGPVVDKHSTGGVGDCVSLVLAPALAALGAFVPMISGRGLGHTGGTLDKLEAIPGWRADQPQDLFRRTVAGTGLAIVAAGPTLAPADRRLYAIRDVTATVESLDLIVASILSKKLAAGLDALVLDVKLGRGALMRTVSGARDLAQALVAAAHGAGLSAGALLTAMDQPLAPAVGNALEVEVALRLLAGERAGLEDLARVCEVLGGEVLVRAGLADAPAEGARRIGETLADGRAMERFAAMILAQGGPRDIAERGAALLPRAPVVRPVAAPRDGHVAAVDAAALGRVVVALGGGRRRLGDVIDPAVGLSALARLGQGVEAGQPLALVHAPDEGAATTACAAVAAAFTLAEGPSRPAAPILGRIS